MDVRTVDYHTAGEPFRIVTGGVPPLQGATVPERRRWAMEHLDDVRALLCREPRGHADMYGCFVTPPDDDGADLGVVFFHNDGFSTACGHGTMALVTWALETGLVHASASADGHDEGSPAASRGEGSPAASRDVEVVVDVPSGRVHTTARVTDGRVVEVRFRNVPARVHAADVTLALRDLRGAGAPRSVTVDIAYGGAFYACLSAASVGCEVTPGALPELIDAGRAIQRAAEEALDLRLPDASDDRGLYGVIFTQRLGPLHQRNATVFADGKVDRSPCGSGTSARLAVLAHRGELATGERFRHDSVIGTTFEASIIGLVERAGVTTVDTEVTGRAFRTGEHRFLLDPDDEVGLGFVLR